MRAATCLVLGSMSLACAEPNPEAEPTPLPELPPELCTTPLAVDEPLCNAALADGPWSISHRTGYAQGSSPAPGPTPESSFTVDRLAVAGIPVILSLSPADADGGRSVWASVQGLEPSIAKLDAHSFAIIDLYVPSERESEPPVVPLGVTGAYTLVDAEGRFVVAQARFVSFFADAQPGDRRSDIVLLGRVFPPASWFCSPDDLIVGLGMAYDGSLVVVTEQGNVVVARAGPDGFDEDASVVRSINAELCGDAPPVDELEIVSNNLAIDEHGGIFVVSSGAMYRFDWTGSELSLAWRASYEAEGSTSPIRLGPGSGSTPSLMGTALDDDRFVVITDGQELMHLVLMWADEIPADWQALPGKDPRIACEIPIRFGDADATSSVSEQSVLVRGHAAVVVNNLVSDPTIVDSFAALQNIITALESGQPDKAPRGIERVDWDPEARSCASVWANPELSVPNGIPTMSSATGLIYAIGKRDGAWGVEGIDFATGSSRLWAPSPTVCDKDLSPFGPLAMVPALVAAFEADPQACENSVYAATTLGPDGAIYTGTLGGVTRYQPDVSGMASAELQAEAGVAQVLDLVARAERASAGAAGLAQLELMQRAALQLLAVDELDGLDAALARALAEALAGIAAALSVEDEAERSEALERVRAALEG